MEPHKEKRNATAKAKLLAAGIAILIVSSGLILLYFENLGNRTNPANTIRVACVGDSITEGFGYPDELWMMLGANYTVQNFGVGGSTVLLSSDKPYMNQPALQMAKNYLPNIVVIMLGTNDASPAYYQNIGDFVNDYKKLVGEFQALTSKPKIWLVKPPPIFNNGSGPNSVNLVQGVIPRIEQVANELGLPTVDVYSALINRPEGFLLDGVHPNNQGVKLIAGEVYRVITSSVPS
jgi:lysophospholipase L1-like esterase